MITKEEQRQIREHSLSLAKKIIAGRNVFDVLQERGYIMQCTNVDSVREYLGTSGRYLYTGFDPTADSLHIGHFLPIMVMAYAQAAGHHPIALMGGGTGMIGDPSGRTDLRKVLTPETVACNVECIQQQMGILLAFDNNGAVLVNNADWLLNLNYISFLRDVGSQFSVNKMLTAECYKRRMEKGLTFLEFNYMLLQAYDFLSLYRRYDLRLELGGDDQWSNILAGIDLVRRKEQQEVFGCTFTLLTNSEGVKMGKTANGAVWINEDKFSVFDFYQYWRNVGDQDVLHFLKLLTFTPLAEIKSYESLSGAELNPIKELLAFRLTEIIHGTAKAEAARAKAKDLFTGNAASGATVYEVQNPDLSILDILLQCKLVPSKSEGRRLFQQGGISVDDTVCTDINAKFDKDKLASGIMVRRGKKNFYRFISK